MSDLAQPVRVARIDIAVGPPLDLAPEERAAIDRHWAETVAANPALWNGSAFVFEDVAITDAGFTATARPTDFATQLFRLRGGLADRALHHVFPVPAVTSRDRRLLLGRQAATTANGGLSYPPSGSFDADDVVEGRLDPVRNLRRELAEEVGLDIDDLEAAPGWWVIPSGAGRIALVRRHRSPLDGAAILARISMETDPHGAVELDAVDLVRFDDPLAFPATVPYVPLLAALLATEAPAPEIHP